MDFMIQEHDQNREAWNEASEHYRKNLNEDLRFLKGGGKNFCAPELKFLEPLAEKCNRAIHLQCAGGTDTLSLINLGIKEVIGVDISEEMIHIARTKSIELQMPATWIVSDILNTPSELNGKADLVYTGRGAINWIMDIEAWGKVIARLLKPGGFLYLFEGHPVTFFFDMLGSDLKFDTEFQGYFSDKTYQSQKWPKTYVGKIKDREEEQSMKYERAWPISNVITSLLKAGLTLHQFEEHPEAYWKEFPNMPDDVRTKFPNTFSLLMKK